MRKVRKFIDISPIFHKFLQFIIFLKFHQDLVTILRVYIHRYLELLVMIHSFQLLVSLTSLETSSLVSSSLYQIRDKAILCLEK